jgi:hypothetical protein
LEAQSGLAATNYPASWLFFQKKCVNQTNTHSSDNAKRQLARKLIHRNKKMSSSGRRPPSIDEQSQQKKNHQI